jgi:diguanylate cyclase (GGDEF)-like protein
LYSRNKNPVYFFIDADNFKAVNDNFGHQVSDEVLQNIANCCDSIRRCKGDVVASYGGDEFTA